jgi:hypothetical protein
VHIHLLSRRLCECRAKGCADDRNDRGEKDEADRCADDQCSDSEQRDDTSGCRDGNSGHLSAVALREAAREGNQSDQTSEGDQSASQKRRDVIA